MIASLILLAAQQRADIPVAARVVEIAGAPCVMNEPEFVGEGLYSSPMGTRVKWSPDGSQLSFLFVRPRPHVFEPPTKDSKQYLGFWSASTRKVTGEYAAPAGYGIDDVMWEGPGGSAIVILNHPDQGSSAKLLRVFPNGKSVEIKTPEAEFSHWTAQTSETERGVLVIETRLHTRERPASHQIYYVPEGQAEGIPVESPPGTPTPPMIDERFQLGIFSRGKPPQAFRFNTATRRFVPTDSKFAWEDRTRGPASIGVGEGIAALQGDRRHLATYGSWWLTGEPKSKYPAALVAPKAQAAELAERTLNVWFVDGGNLFVRRIKKITQDQVDDLLECEERAVLLMHAKQVGTGIIIFMTDNDDHFPPATGFREKVYPYIKNNELLDGFVYSYKGPSSAVEVAEPSKTELGYKDGQFGRAVVRTDSSAVWESRRKKPNKEGC